MPVLPYWDRIPPGKATSSQKDVLAVLTYLTALVFGGLLFFACYNYYKFLLKAQPRRKVLDPLSMFYILSICTIFLRMLSIIYTEKIDIIFMINLELLPPLFKLNTGLIQAWIMIELSLRVKQSLDTLKEFK